MDIEGSTRRWVEDATAMRAALERQDAIFANAVRVTGDLIFKHTGDGILASMPSVGAAASSALDAQAALLGADWSPFDSLPVRMAIHAGDVELAATTGSTRD